MNIMLNNSQHFVENGQELRLVAITPPNYISLLNLILFGNTGILPEGIQNTYFVEDNLKNMDIFHFPNNSFQKIR